MKLVIWGCGNRGKMLYECMKKMHVIAFIDSDKALIGKVYKDVPIISFEEYMKSYNECYLIVSQSVVSSEIISIIKKNGIKRYFDLNRCPKELPNWEGELPFAEMLARYETAKEKKIILVGINLFAIMLYEYLREKTEVSFAWIDEQKEINNELIKDNEHEFVNLEDYQRDNVIVLKTDSFLDKLHIIKVNGICFYRFPYLKKYDYPSLKRFCNLHRGQRCFIVATGPSLQMSDLDRLYKYDEICMSVNTVYKAFSLTKWRPRYYFYEDSGINNKIIDEIKGVDVKYKFLADRRLQVVDSFAGKNRFVYKTYSEYYEEEGPNFSSDIEEGTFFGYTVLYQCLQFALYMGFQEIYIIGADCEYKNFGGSGDHFIDDYEDNTQKGFLNTNKIFAAYKVARKEAESRNINIYNATRGGKLEIFERVDFDTLF